MTRSRIVLIGAITVAVVVVGGPWMYINVFRDEAPERLGLTSTASTMIGTEASDTSASIEGSWSTTAESVVGYRVREILFGQSTEGVGRTNDVQGSLVMDGSGLPSADFTVNMTSIASDDSRRDRQFNDAIMETDRYPQARFVLSTPVQFSANTVAGETLTTTALGNLTLRGRTKPIDVLLQARLVGGEIEVAGAITIVFDEWEIPIPSRPGISVEDRGEIEFRLVFDRS